MLIMSGPLVFGSERLKDLVARKSTTWDGGLIFMKELAYDLDNDKHYWIVKTNGPGFLSIMCDRWLGCVGWGTIRKGEDGKMQICQAMPKKIEESLRKQTIKRLLEDKVSGVSLFSSNEGSGAV
jgi:hypothetical protein